MELVTKEKIAVTIALTLLSVANGAAGARVLHSLLVKRLKNREKRVMNERSFRVMLSRLKKDGLVESGGWGLWRLTKKGRDLARGAEDRADSYFRARTLSQERKNTIVIFDVPESRRKLRDYLRAELMMLGYEQLQKSVWIGGGPLPGAFMDFVREKNLMNTMHIFTIEKRGTMTR